MSLHHTLATSDHTLAVLARRLHRGITHVNLPAPRAIVVPERILHQSARDAIYFLRRVLIAEPLFKSYCTSYGDSLHTGVFVHWVTGKGRIIVGDNVSFDGKSSICFASRFTDSPTLEVGNNTSISHACRFTVGKRITIGSHVRIAGGVTMFDSSGHPVDAEARAAGLPPDVDDVHPIEIQDHVWIGRQATIFPGITVGEGAVISSCAVVTSNVAPYTIVAGNPARRIGKITQHPHHLKLIDETEVKQHG